MKTDTLRAKLLNCFFAFTLVFGLCIPTLGVTSPSSEAYAADETMTVYYDFKEVKPAASRPGSIAVNTLLLFAPTSVTTVSTSEAFLSLPSGCGMMKVSSLTKGSSNRQPSGSTNFIAAVVHPDNAQKAINTKVGFDGCNGSFWCTSSDNTYWHYACDGGGVPNASFRVYTYNQATVNKSNLTAKTTTKKEVSSTDIHIPKNELAVTLNVNGRVFNIDSSRWTFVDDTVNYVKNDRQITIQFGNVQASCNVDFYGQAPDPHAYKSVARDTGATGNLKVGETLHYNVKVTNEATTGSIWKDVTINDTLPVGLELVPGSVNLARTQTIDPNDHIPSISLTESNYRYDSATRTMSLTIPYYVLNSQAYELTYDVTVDPTAIAGGTAGGANETRDLTNTVNVTGHDSDNKIYNCDPTACLPIPGVTNPDDVKVEQVVPGSENDPDPDPTKTDPIAYLEHSKVATNMTDTREGAVTQVYDIIKYTMTMENTKPGSVFRDAQFVDQMPQGLDILLNDAEHPMAITKASTTGDDRYWTDSWSEPVTADSYDSATRTLTAPCGDMFYGEKVTLTFYAQVTPDALGGDIGNVGTIEAATPQVDPETKQPVIDPETGNPETEKKTDDIPDPTYPDPEKDKPTTTEVEKPVIDPETGEPKVDPETGDPITETVTETTGGVAAGDPEPKVEKTISVIAKKEGVEVTDSNKNVPQVGDTVRTTVVVTNLKEGTEWVNVKVNDSCNSALELIPDSIRVFDPEGNDVTDQCFKPDPNDPLKITLDIPAVTGGAAYTLQYDALVTGDAVSNDPNGQPNITDPVEVNGETPDPSDDTPATAEDKPTDMARPGDPLDSVIKTMKVLGSNTNAVKVGDTVQYTIIAGNMGDKTTQALRPIVLDPLPEGVEFASDYVYVTKMTFNNRSQEWEKASPSYVRKIVRSNVYNEAARTLVVPVGEVLANGADRVCQGQTGYQIVFECKVTSVALAAHENLGNIAYSESEKPSEQPTPSTPDDPINPDNPDNPNNYPTDDDGDIIKTDPETGDPVIDPETGEPEKIKDPDGKPIKPGDKPEDHPSIPDGNLDDYIKDQIDPPIVVPEPVRPTYPTDEDGDIVNPDGDKVKDPEGNPIKPGDTKEDHPSIPDDVDLDDYIQEPTYVDPTVNPDPDNPTPTPGAEPVRDPDRPVYPTDKDGDIIIPEIDPTTGEPKVDDEGYPVGEKVKDPEGNPIKNTDTPKDHPSIPGDIDDYIQNPTDENGDPVVDPETGKEIKGTDPIPVEYPVDEDGDVVIPVVDPETGNPVVDPDTGEPKYEKVVGPDDQPVKPDQTEVLEDLDIPKITALHQVIKEVAKLADDGTNIAGKVTYDSGKTGTDRVTTENDTTYEAGDKINTTVKVKNLVKGTRWAGAIVIDKPSNMIVTYYELVDPYGNTLTTWGDKGQYAGVMTASTQATQATQAEQATQATTQSDVASMLANASMVKVMRSAYADTLDAGVTPRAATPSSVARLKYDGKQFRLSAAEIVGLEQYQVYYEGYVPEGTKAGNLEELIEDPTSNNPLDDIKKNDGPEVPANTPEGAKLPEPTPETPTVADPNLEDLRITLSAKNEMRMDGETQVGDEVTYTITLENRSTPDKPWLDVVARADIPVGLDFVPGSIVLVTADGQVINVPDTAYDPESRILAVNVGDITSGKDARVIFKAEATTEMENSDIGMIAKGYGTLPSQVDPDDESYVKPDPGTAFVPEEGWAAFEENHVVVTHTEKVYPNEKSETPDPAVDNNNNTTKLASSADKPVVTQKLAKTSDTTATTALGIGALALLAACALVIARRRMKRD